MSCLNSRPMISLAGILFLVFLGGCGGGDSNFRGNAYTAEGTSSDPVSIAQSDLPYTGQVDTTISYYQVTGLTPATTYTVTISGMTTNVDLTVYYDAFVTQLCASSNTDTTTDSCDTTPNNLGELFIGVDGGLGGNTNFTLDVQSGSGGGSTTYENEGSRSSPISFSLANMPYSGQVADDGDSYYLFTSLDTTVEFAAFIKGATADLTLAMALDYFDNYPSLECSGSASSGVDGSCASYPTTSGITGRIHFRVSTAPSPAPGSAYTIDLGYANQGTANAPLTYAQVANLSIAGQVGKGSSYYKITGVSPNGYYMFATSTVYNSDNQFDSVDKNIYKSDFIQPECADPFATGCSIGFANAAGELFATVQFPGTGIGATYNIQNPYKAFYIPSEGTSVNTINLNLGNVPYSGKVGGNNISGLYSYYMITPLTGSKYRVRLTDYTEEIGLELHSAGDFSGGSSICYDDLNSNYGSVSCEAPSWPATLYIRVYNPTINGTYFTMNVEDISNPPPFTGEGSTITPISIPFGPPYTAGTVDSGNSYYMIHRPNRQRLLQRHPEWTGRKCQSLCG